MDYCSTESELIESLDYLTLPVKRSTSYAKDRPCEDLPTKTSILRDYRRTVSHKTQTSHSLHKCNESLVLNRTKEEIVEYYAFVSSTENTPSSKFLAYLQSEEIPSQIKDRSLIKVTVTPKITKPHKLNVFTRRKQNTKHIHSTASDEDHSIQTRNVYLVVSGEKREKHYNIKTTESARLLEDNHKLNDDISLEQVKNAKQVIHSLNMDKRRKKGAAVNKEKKRTVSPSRTKMISKKEGKKEDNIQRKKYETEDNKEENNNEPNQARSIVRITGQIGLGQNNQLLMKCGVEGKKAPANIELKSYPSAYFHNAGTLLHTVTQGTQMDMEMINTQKEDTHKSKAAYYTENLACLCKNDNVLNQFDNTPRNLNQAERRQSPLVVITVYPNDERCESVKIYKKPGHSSPVNIYEGYKDVNCMHETNLYPAENKYYSHGSDIEFTDNPEIMVLRRPRSVSRILRENEFKNARHSYHPRNPRSQSQSTSSSQNVKRQDIKNNDTNKSAPKAKPTSPARSPRNQSPNRNYIQNTKQQGIDKSIPRKNKNEPKSLRGPNQTPKNRSPRSPSPVSLSPSSRSPSTHSDQKTKPKEKENQRKKGIESKQRDLKKTIKEEKVNKSANFISAGTNTDHTWTKRTLVDTFTKEVLGQMEKNKKGKNPQTNDSQVTISIDGDNENYDVLFQQGGRTTDLRVKKTVKRSPAKRNKDAECDNNKKDSSLTNLLNVQHDYGYESPAKKNEKLIGPEIKVRDSLEIGHNFSRAKLLKAGGTLILKVLQRFFNSIFSRAQRQRRGTGARRQHSPRLTLDNMNFADMQARPRVNDTESFAPIKHFIGDDCLIPDPVKRDREIRHLLGIEKQSKNSPPITTFKIQDSDENHRQEETRMKKEVTNQCSKSQKNLTHKINFAIARKRKTASTQYEIQNVALDSPFSKKMILNRNIQVFLQVEKFTEQKPIILSRKQYHKIKRAIDHTISKHPKQKLSKAKCSVVAYGDFRKKEKILTNQGNQTKARKNVSNDPIPTFAYKDTEVLFTAAFNKKKEPERHSVCSRDVRISYSEPISSTKVTVGSVYSHSIHTIFRGFRKPHTPNLGTSTCSFYSGDSNEFYETSVQHFKAPLEKPRKPFLRRLMSCLVLRTSTASGAKMAALPKPKASCNSCTVDSYHISTSLAALEMSSSIYDTSESFYSNHSILPLNNKIKRSFFGSVRGLLTYGRN